MSYYSAGDYYMAGQLWDTIGSAFESGSMAELPSQGTYAQQAARGSPTVPGTGYNVPRSWGTGPGGARSPWYSAYPRRRYRRMNPLNVRALRRGMRRVKGFAKIAHSVMSFTKTHKLKHHRRRR